MPSSRRRKPSSVWWFPKKEIPVILFSGSSSSAIAKPGNAKPAMTRVVTRPAAPRTARRATAALGARRMGSFLLAQEDVDPARIERLPVAKLVEGDVVLAIAIHVLDDV